MSLLAWLSGFLGGLIGAVAGALIAGHYTRLETRQRESAARREEWWRRFEWAASLAVSQTEPSKTAGLHMLTALGESWLAGPDEARMLESFSQSVLGVLFAETEPSPYDVFVLRVNPDEDGEQVGDRTGDRAGEQTDAQPDDPVGESASVQGSGTGAAQ